MPFATAGMEPEREFSLLFNSAEVFGHGEEVEDAPSRLGACRLPSAPAPPSTQWPIFTMLWMKACGLWRWNLLRSSSEGLRDLPPPPQAIDRKSPRNAILRETNLKGAVALG